MLRTNISEAQSAAPAVYPTHPITHMRLDELIFNLASGQNLGEDTGPARAWVQRALTDVRMNAPATVFDGAWDKLYEASGRSNAFGAHRAAVDDFLKAGEARRLVHAQRVVENSNDPDEMAHALELLRAVSKRALNADLLVPARNLEAQLSQRLMSNALHTIKGTSPMSRAFKPALKRKFFANVHGEMGPVLLREVQGLAEGSMRYTIGETFDLGGVGKVHAAMDENGHLCAVKVQRIEDLPDDARVHATDIAHVNDIKGEARAQRKAGNELAPFEVVIVDNKVYSFCDLAGAHMEKMREELHNHALFPLLVRKMFLDVITDLKDIHDQQMLHRDVKLQNILSNRRGGMRLTDFGLHHNGATAEVDTSYPLGSAGYTAPEVSMRDFGNAYGRKVDVFSAGLCCLYMLIEHKGDVPFYNADVDPDSDASVETDATTEFEASMRAAVQDFNGWRASRSIDGRPDGKISLELVRQGNSAMDRVYLQSHGRDQQFTDYLFEHILKTDPNTRHDTNDALIKAHLLMAPHAHLADSLKDLMSSVDAKNENLNASIHALQMNYRMQQRIPR